MSALAVVGEEQRARDLMERLLRIASPLGLYAEEFDADTGRHLGNFPQAFSHLALIEAAGRIILAERLEELMMNGAYDVIIIGTGAGGGTLARHLAPSGKRILLLERGDWLPREPQNWSTADVFVDNRYISPDTWYDARRQGVPAADPLLRRRRHQAVRRRAVPAARARTSASCSHHDGLSPAWPISLRRHGALLHPGRAALPGARRPRRGPDRAAGQRALPVSRRCRHEPRIQQLSDDLAAAGYHPFHAPCGVMLNEAEHAVQHLRPLRHAATASRAWCTPSPTPRCWASGRRWSIPTSPC